VTDRKQNVAATAKSKSVPRSTKSDKDNLAAGKGKTDEKKSAKKGEIKREDAKPESGGAGNQVAKSSKPAPTPNPSPKPTPTVSPVTPAVASPTPKGEGTFTLEVCSVSGLLPVRGVCKNTVRRRFKLGSEPTRFCTASH
jgi:hypothetical protein